MKIKSIIKTTKCIYAVSDAETNEFYKNRNGEPKYAIGHMSVLFNTSQIEKVYPMDRDISGVEE